MDQIEISGVVDSVIFSNAETGFAILELERDGTGEPVVVTGTIPYASEGDCLKVWGKWVIHPVYGEQLKATSYEKSLPAERGQILRYLASGAVKGIGPKTALKIVDKYGESSFEVIENHPDWLAEIPGISRKKAAEVSKAFREASGARSVLIRFKDYLSDAASMKIYKRWGSSAIDRVKENPYILCEEIRGVGFAKADAVAMSFGIAKDSPFRISGGIVSYLQSAGAKEGHTCLKLEELKAGCAEMLGVDPETVHDIIVEMLVAARLRVVSKNNEKYIYLPSLFNAEKYIASKLVSLATRCETYDEVDAERMIMKLERTNDIVYDALQREAISDTLKSGVMILTGGPGTGKTTVIKAIISIFRSLGMEIALAAPTGRAAKRMSEATSFEAKTIHRLLCMEFSGENENGKFLKDEHDRLDEDLIIIDESSMVDVLLMEALLKAVKPGARLIFIGDADQLPPVGAGNVFADIIESGAFATVKLKTIFRQETGSMIIKNAHAINEGKIPDISNSNNDFFFMPRASDEETAQTIASLVHDRLPRKYKDEVIGKIQVMAPSRKGVCGTESLNRLLQSVMNPAAKGKREHRYGETVFREGDRVMQTRNNYAVPWVKDGIDGEGIFNGDIGVIEEIDSAEHHFIIDFEDRVCEYDMADLEDLEHAWAITVHKSQGSEYPVVIMPMRRFPPMLMTRNLFYTAVTRAKKIVVLVGDAGVVADMVKNNNKAVRYTCLKEMIKKECEK